MLFCQSILGIKEGNNPISKIAKIAKKTVEPFISIEPISLIQCGIIVLNVFEDLLIEVVT